MTYGKYQSSSGEKDIAKMTIFNVRAAHAKLLREEPHRTVEIAGLAARMAADDEERARADAIGHNNPPADAPIPVTFEAVHTRIGDLLRQAAPWSDSGIGNQAAADEVARLMDEFRKVAKVADEARKLENEPFDTGKAAVQTKYAPLIADTKTQRGVVVIALESLKGVLTPWLQKIEAEQKAKAAEAQKVADEAAARATEARKEAEGGDLIAAVEAEELGQAAAVAFDSAKQAVSAKAHAQGGARATGLRSYWTPYLTDPKEALLHYLKAKPEDLRAMLVEFAEADIKAGVRSIPGFRIEEDRRVA